MTTDPVGVVDAELVDEEPAPLPAVPAPAGRPLVDRHTMLRPGAPLPTDDDAPTYTERDLYVSEATAQLLDDAPPPNTSTQYRSAWNRFTAWCDQEGRVVASPQVDQHRGWPGGSGPRQPRVASCHLHGCARHVTPDSGHRSLGRSQVRHRGLPLVPGHI